MASKISDSKGNNGRKTCCLKDKLLSVFDTRVKQVSAVVIAAALIVIIIVVLIRTFGGTGTVLISEDFENYNGGFYSTDAYEKTATSFVVPAEGEGVDGGACLKIVNSSDNDARLTAKIQLKAGKVYRVEADIKASVTSEKKAANISILGSKDSGFTYVNSETWTHVTDYITAGKTDTYTLCMRLGYYGNVITGTAWIDNVKVTQVSGAPSGKSVVVINSVTSTVTSAAEYNENLYADMRIVSWLILALAFFALLLYGLYVRAYDRIGGEFIGTDDKIRFIPGRRKLDAKAPFDTLGNPVGVFVTVFTLALGIRLVLSITYFECGIDVGLFKYWGRVAAENGIGQLYNIATNCDYPPLYAYFLAFVTHVGNLLKLGQTGMGMMVKLPSIFADMLVGLVIYFTAVKKRYSFGSAMFFAAVWLFNPVVLIDASCWGQVDSLLALFVILCCISLNGRRFLAAGLFFSLGIMLKPQMTLFLPVLGCVFLSEFVMEFVRKRPKRAFGFLGKILLGLVTGAVLPCIPFFGMGTAEVELFGKSMELPWIFKLFLGTIDHYQYATVNNYNFWFLVGQNWVPDSEMAGPLSLHTWGMLAIVVISLVTVAVYVFKTAKAVSRGKLTEKVSHPGLVFLAGAFMFAMVSCFGPRMHERYFFPAVALLLMAAICYHRKGVLAGYGLISGIGFITVHEIMLGLLVGGSIRDVNDNSAVYGDFYWPKLNEYRGWLAAITVIAALVCMGLFIFNRRLERKEFSDDRFEPEDSGKGFGIYKIKAFFSRKKTETEEDKTITDAPGNMTETDGGVDEVELK